MRAFAEVVREHRRAEAGDRRRGGRPPLPAFVKGLGRLRQAVAMATAEQVTEASFAHYAPEAALELMDELDAHIEALEALKVNVLETVQGLLDETGCGPER